MIPRIVAHRGFCKAHPENSLSAFRSAERIGCEWVECDVHSSADGVPVVIHDDTLDRTTSGSGPVAAKAFSDLSDLRLKFGDRLTGEPVPTLSRLLAALRPATGILVEIKPHDSPGLVRNVLSMLRAERRPWVLQSFDPATVLEIHARDPAAPAALLVEDAPSLARALGEAWRGVHSDHALLTPDIVATLRTRRMGVGAWTVNTPDDLRRVIALGVDWLITDEPLVARELCNGKCD